MKIQKYEFEFAVTQGFLFHCDLENKKITDLHLFEDINQFPASVPFLHPF